VPPASDREQVRKNVLARFGLEPDTRLVVFLGRLHPMKRPAETAAAFRAVAPAGWTLIVAGPEEGVPRSAIASERRVIAPGGVFGTGKGELLAAADALVLFSHRENFGFAVTEALAQGTPVLISDELDLAPEIAATKSGWIADGRNHEGRMRGIVEVTGTMRSECVARGLRGRAWVADQLSEARFAENLRRIVENGMQGENRDIATHEQVGAVAERAS
jgi:glycosyltransferase involved in cell wall biosynthesis